MASPRETGNQTEELPSPQEIVRKFAGLHADRLLYKSLLENAQLEDEDYEKWRKTEAELLHLTLETLPRIQSQELSGIISVENSPADSHFYVVLPGGRLKIIMETERVQAKFPSLVDMLPPRSGRSPK